MNEKKNYNETHPELRKGEMFLTNSHDEDYIKLRWHSKRRGRRAYTIEGEPITGYLPVFVQRSESEEGMKKYE